MRGSCLCGAVAFEVEGSGVGLYQCHCSLCRKQGGGASNAAMIVDAAKLRWIAGQAGISSYVRPTGFRSDFCANCGSPVPNPLRETGFYWVPAGLLEEGAALKVVAHLFVGSKAHWDVIATDGMRFETMPDLTTLLALLGASDRSA